MSSNKIVAIMILEILGKPPEHLIETLEKIIDEIKKEKGVEVLSKKIMEPVQLKENKDFYTSFAEIEVQVEKIDSLAMLMFKYTPANIQVIEPEKILVDNALLSDVLSEIIRRLHGYDEVARVIQIENQKMKQQMQEIMQKNSQVKPITKQKDKK